MYFSLPDDSISKAETCHNTSTARYHQTQLWLTFVTSHFTVYIHNGMFHIKTCKQTGRNKYLCCLGLCGGLRLLLLLCCTCRSALRPRRTLWSPRLSSSTRSLERWDILKLTLFYSPLTITPGGRGVRGEEGLHIKQCVTLIMHLSMATVMQASSYRKPASICQEESNSTQLISQNSHELPISSCSADLIPSENTFR